MTRCDVDSVVQLQISVSAKRLLRRADGPLRLKQIQEMVIAKLGRAVDHQQLLDVLQTSAKNGVPRFFVDGDMVGLTQRQRPGPRGCKAAGESCPLQPESFEAVATQAQMAQISKATKKLLCSLGGCMPLDDIQDALRVNGWDWKHEQVLHALQKSAKNGVPRYVLDGDMVRLAEGPSCCRRAQKHAATELAAFLQETEFSSCPWNSALSLSSFRGHGEFLQHVVQDERHSDGRPRFEVRKLHGADWIFATESVRRYSQQDGS